MLPSSYSKYKDVTKEIEDYQIKQEEEIKNIKVKEIQFDFEKGDFYFTGNEPKHLLTNKELVIQWVKKLFLTNRNSWNCYRKDLKYDFGLDIKKYVGKQLFPDLFHIELIKDDIYKSLLNHRFIKNVHYLQLVQVDEKMYCGFILELEEGAIEYEEVF